MFDDLTSSVEEQTLQYCSSVDDMVDEQMTSSSACAEQIDMMCMYISKKGWLYDVGSNLMDRMMYSWLWSEWYACRYGQNDDEQLMLIEEVLDSDENVLRQWD